MTVGYKFPILNSDGTPSTTYVDMDDMFVSADTFVEKGLYAWGSSSQGGLGDGTIVSKSSPVQIGSLTNWKQVDGGQDCAAAIRSDYTLWTWGNNNSGRLGDGTIIFKSSPVQIGSLTNWKQVSISQGHTAAIKTDGTLWTWGNGATGRLGDGTTASKSSPVQIGSLTNWKQVSVGSNHTAAIKTDGTIWTWGQNGAGQLGDGTIINKSSPIQVGLLTDWKQVACGDGSEHVVSIKTDGTLWTWGNGANGRLGDGTIVSKSSPVQIGSLTNWKQVAVGESHNLAVKTDGTLWAWGRNVSNELGDGTIVSKSSPVQIGSLTNWKQISCGYNSSYAIKTDGTIWAWGSGSGGRLGDGTIVSKSSPIQIGSLTNWKQVSGGDGNTHGILQFDGSASKARTVEYVTLVSNTSSGTTYTFNNVNIGTEDYSRYVVVGVFGHNGGTAELTLSNCAIDGENDTLITNSNSIVGNKWATGLYGKAIPAGSTANVSVTFGGSASGAAIAIWTLYNLNSLTATAGVPNSNKLALSYSPGDIFIIAAQTDDISKTVAFDAPITRSFGLSAIETAFKPAGGQAVVRTSFSGDFNAVDAVITVGAVFR